MRRMAFATKSAIVVVTIFALVMTHGSRSFVDAGRSRTSTQRKTSSNSNQGHVTQPSYSTNNNNNGGGNSHADVAKLSYPNYNSQPNRPANPPVGWNVPQGPPPAYSAHNPAGGARTNVHEPPPSYHAPNYGAAPGSNVHQPITATQNHGQQYSGVPAGATYYPAGPGGHMQGGGYQPHNLPAGATYYPSAGHMPAGGYNPAGGYHPAAAPPPGATYYQAGSALPPGATYYAQPPQQSSSGLGFGTGLIAGGLGGALLGHALTPSGGSSSQMAPAPAAAAGQDRIIIINNGVPVNASDGTTVINAGAGAAAPAAAAAAPVAGMAAAPPAQLAPFSPENTPMPAVNGTDGAAQPPPPPGGIICVPTKVNETDPADSSKMIEVEKIACYPAPPAPVAAPGEGPAPLAPMANNPPPPAMLPPDQAAVRSNMVTSAGSNTHSNLSLSLITALLGALLLRITTAGN
ncbi:CG5273 [Drosophila busckii]|uniref:CG5273 n=1 Tax=Drosophila busckii TaxID=30019 RepID=A0A0M5J861_DROBS|nr:protein transport protein SEC31 [Drosophila busckii]XP_017852684.1 protein transport protein SEC31 [Drosophila busckii]ALC49068.1 CG5273 [Drosophila busckii]